MIDNILHLFLFHDSDQTLKLIFIYFIYYVVVSIKYNYTFHLFILCTMYDSLNKIKKILL